MSDRAFTVRQPHMKGTDVHEWQDWLQMTFRRWDINYPITIDGDYGVATRSATATVCESFGLAAPYGMQEGVTPGLRTKLRDRRFTDAERKRFRSRVTYRRKLRERFDRDGNVHTPVSQIITDTWGYHPPVHDGIDLICPPDATLYAICDGTIIRADAGGWWGKGAPADLAVRARGDGIVIIRCSTSAGPFKPGLNMCYGHAEHSTVQAGEHVKAGDIIGRAGLANAWHVHFMVNGNDNNRGVGDRDPRPFTDYARKV